MEKRPIIELILEAIEERIHRYEHGHHRETKAIINSLLAILEHAAMADEQEKSSCIMKLHDIADRLENFDQGAEKKTILALARKLEKEPMAKSDD